MSKDKHPFDRPYLKRLVGGMLRVPQHANRIASLLDPQWIEDDMLCDVAEVSQTHIRRYKRLPTKLVIRQECGQDVVQSSTFKSLYKIPVKDMAYCVDKLSDFCKTQAMKRAILDSVKDIERGDVSSVITRTQEALKVGMDFTNLGMRFSDWKGRRKHYMESDLVLGLVPSGFDHLDQIMQGGLGSGELGVIMGASGSGKSFVLMNLGLQMALAGKKVVHYTFELKDSKLLRRYDKRFVGKHAALVQSAPEKFLKYLGRQHRILLSDDQEQQGDVLVHYAPTRSFTPSMIRSHLDAVNLAFDYRPDVILVDYGDIMRPERRIGEPRHEQAGIFEDLRGIAGEFNCPLWTATQANRAALEKKVIRKQDVAESFEKVMIADAVVSICATPEEKEEGRFRFFLAKMRDSADEKTITGSFDFSIGRMLTDGIQTSVATESDESKGQNKRGQKRLEQMKQAAKSQGRDLSRKG